MTVIAGVSLFNGVMLLSDCRVTVQRRGKPDVHGDIGQKLFPLTQNAAIGFCGDVATAALLLGVLRRQMPKREHKDIASLLQWLPRLFQSGVATLQAKKKRVAPVDFMLAGIIPDRANVVERAKVVELMKDIASGNGSIQRSFVPDIVMQVMMTPPDREYVVIGNSPAGVLCTMRYPSFEPQFLKPLEFAAIGSGQHSIVEIKKYADWLLAGVPGNDMIERSSLTDAVSQFIAENEVKDVGGMYPCVKIDRRGVGCLGIHQKFPLYEVSLTYDTARGRWIQENYTTGKKIELLTPWEVMRDPSAVDQKFDDMREAVEHANPLCPGFSHVTFFSSSSASRATSKLRSTRRKSTSRMTTIYIMHWTHESRTDIPRASTPLRRRSKRCMSYSEPSGGRNSARTDRARRKGARGAAPAGAGRTLAGAWRGHRARRPR